MASGAVTPYPRRVRSASTALGHGRQPRDSPIMRIPYDKPFHEIRSTMRLLMTTNHPLVTVGIPCFNAETTIRRAVESVLAQTWPHREILIVDDASTDSSRSILADLERVQPEIRVIWHRGNRGFPEAATPCWRKPAASSSPSWATTTKAILAGLSSSTGASSV